MRIIATGSESIRRRRSSESCLMLNGYGSLRGHAADVFGVLKPAAAVRPRRALLTACDTPPDGLSWPKRFVKPNARSKGRMRHWWLMRSRSPYGAESSPGKHGAAVALPRTSNARVQYRVFFRAWRTVMKLLLLPLCGSDGAAAAPNESVHTQTEKRHHSRTGTFN